MKKVTRIKDNITKTEFNHLLNYIQADSTLRTNRKDRLLKVINLLYITGLRVNETTQLTNNKLLELLNTKSTKVIAHKQALEKKIFITESGAKQLKKYFVGIEHNDNYLFVSERGTKRTALATNSVIRDINTYLKKVFINKNITTHSFRQSLITELAQANINTKIIQTLIGHKDISTTYNYIKIAEKDMINSLNLVR